MRAQSSLALTSIAIAFLGLLVYAVAIWSTDDDGRSAIRVASAGGGDPPADAYPVESLEDSVPRREQPSPSLDPTEPAREEASAVEDVARCWQLSEPQALEACIEAWLAARPFPSAEEQLGDLICRVSGGQETGLPEEATYRIVAALLEARAHGDLVASFDAIYGACERSATGGRLLRAVLDLRERDPDLFAQARGSLVAERLFDPAAGVGAVILAVELAQRLEDAELQALLAEGARGAFGGTDAQVDRATGAAFAGLEPGAPSLAFARELAGAPFLLDGTPRKRLGSSLAAAAMSPLIAGACDEGEVVAFVQSLLDDPVLARGTAEQIVSQWDADHPPVGLSMESWAALWSRAQEVSN